MRIARHCVLWTLLLLFFFSVAVSGAATTKTKQPNDKNTEDVKTEDNRTRRQHPSLPPRKTRAAQRAASAPHYKPEDDARPSNHSFRMQEYSLAEHVASLSNKDNRDSFENLLKWEEERQRNAAVPTMISRPQLSPVFLTALGGTSILALVSWLVDPLSTGNLWKKSIGKRLENSLALAWLPLVWAHPTRFAIADLLILIQLARQPAILPYLRKQVLPFMMRSLQALIVTELWTRIWKWFFVQLDSLQKYFMAAQQPLEAASTDEKGTSASASLIKQRSMYTAFGFVEWPTDSIPAWLEEIHSLIVGSVRKGIRSSFRKSVQETIVTSLSVCKDALMEQILSSS